MLPARKKKSFLVFSINGDQVLMQLMYDAAVGGPKMVARDVYSTKGSERLQNIKNKITYRNVTLDPPLTKISSH